MQICEILIRCDQTTQSTIQSTGFYGFLYFCYFSSVLLHSNTFSQFNNLRLPWPNFSFHRYTLSKNFNVLFKSSFQRMLQEEEYSLNSASWFFRISFCYFHTIFHTVNDRISPHPWNLIWRTVHKGGRKEGYSSFQLFLFQLLGAEAIPHSFKLYKIFFICRIICYSIVMISNYNFTLFFSSLVASLKKMIANVLFFVRAPYFVHRDNKFNFPFSLFS